MFLSQQCMYVQSVLRANGRAVLQFKIDFRLDWFKTHFPMATIVHLYRQPRNQWLSFLKKTRDISLQKTL